jgi:hypothetical protein
MYLGLQNHIDQVQECTSGIFEGLISMNDPAHSWVARWQRLEGYVKGIYAVKVIGVVCLLRLTYPFFGHSYRFVVGGAFRERSSTSSLDGIGIQEIVGILRT